MAFRLHERAGTIPAASQAAPGASITVVEVSYHVHQAPDLVVGGDSAIDVSQG
jgi:hypothetical protein